MKGKVVLLALLAFVVGFSSACLADDYQIDFHPTANIRQFVSQPLGFMADDNNLLRLQIEANDNSTATVFFLTSYNSMLSQAQAVSFPVHKGVKTYYLNMSARNKYWLGQIQRLLLVADPAIGPPKILDAKVAKANLLTRISSGWQEFMQLETIKGLTVNVIKGPTIQGKQVNYYAYLIIGVSFLFLSIKKRNINVIRPLLGVIVVLIILLEVRMWYDHYRLAATDKDLLWGKTLQEKRSLTTGNGIVEFAAFCEKELPARSIIGFVTPGPYFFGKLAYFLYPHRTTESPEYLLVFHQEVDKITGGNYVLFAKFKEGEYILKKI
ncbi:MAG: hypothetical protein ABIJ41_05005 [Candidatus Omnitrophota bacterium]